MSSEPWLDLTVIDRRRDELRKQRQVMSESQIQDLIRAEHGLPPLSAVRLFDAAGLSGDTAASVVAGIRADILAAFEATPDSAPPSVVAYHRAAARDKLVDDLRDTAQLVRPDVTREWLAAWLNQAIEASNV